ncbi:2-hydroxyacid dehydrogenase [Aureibacter tunicatorum]|uniref:D-3-phosphoglycerate dehydrogenase n=1 Tax=Aureibacter tunicatorum TaxID=866807 RepID=A0AAE3XQH5_9BACT|nr:2-hydroxyacid dehydrogenase [Aureibacter tunicatorum]MDR6241262.1 D-3-phosphoglycerate dehydrogenase [Aureibacter tunicatorum]BDD03522.1 2-hydroxyacid dehydrogenase [Aureibacter tunicatorum]
MKILVIDKMHDSITSLLGQKGFEVDYKPKISRSEILDTVHAYDGMVVRSKTPIDKELIDKAVNLKFIARAGAGIDQLDVQELENKGVRIVNAPEGNRDAVGEHTIGMLLCLFNNIVQGDAQVRKGIWDREGNRGVELMGKTVAIIGYGNMGRAFAQRLKCFGCDVLAFDKYKENYSDEYATEATWDEIFQKADILSLHTPLTFETKEMIDSELLNKFAKDIYIINVARGEIAPFSVLEEALKSGKLKGALLDVLENEKLAKLTDDQKENFENLVKRDNVLFSPHVAGWTHESYRKINEVLTEKIAQLFE